VQNKNKKILVTQSFGKKSEYFRAIFSILSAIAYADTKKINSLQVVLFTDNPIFFTNWLKGINVYYVELTSEKIKQMRGDIDFLHRMKIALIEESFNIYPNCDMLYFDSDTFFINNPIRIFEKVSENIASMHLLEYKFETLKNRGETFKEFYDLINSKKFSLNNGAEISVSNTDESWNAGVMCFHSTHSKFIPDAYKLTEQFYPLTQNHASEQYAFSIVFQKNVSLTACDDIIYHYWYRVKKEIMDIFLNQEFSDSFEKLELEQKLKNIIKYTHILPQYFEKHFLSLKDNAIQEFNKNNYLLGYKWALKAFIEKPFIGSEFLKDILYHTKRNLLKK
jgi:hypothetical protein